MTPALERSDVECFRTVIAQRLGLHFEDGKLDFLADVLRRRLAESGCDRFASYLERLTCPQSISHELQPVTQQLTVPETYFFRNPDQFRALAEVVLPECVRARQARRRLRVLSAGCASGEEPYSLAILVRDLLRDLAPDHASWQIDIRGIDVNAAMIEKAARARYSEWSLRGMAADVRERCFRTRGDNFALDESIREMVSFEVRNLVEEDPGFWQAEAFDVVFCRNVLMYFTPDVTRAVVARIARALRSGGFLFLGHAENLRGVSQEFHLCHTHDTFYYRRRDASEPRVAPLTPAPFAAEAAAAAALPAAVEAADSWIDAIGRASQRIATLAQEPSRRSSSEASKELGRTSAAAPSPPADRGWDLGLALELLRHERFASAMDLLRALPAESRSDPDTLLLRAVLLTNSGGLAEAEEVCSRLLELDELNAGARYLMALCREHAGDRAAAVEHDQAAIYLAPRFAMPHFHLGLLAKRGRDLATSRRELGKALTLLGSEDASRILLFGGGFNREALVRLCARELRACGQAS